MKKKKKTFYSEQRKELFKGLKMKKLLLLISLVICHVCDIQSSHADIGEVQISFKKLGYLATGNHYGHLFTTVELKRVRFAIDNATKFLEQTGEAKRNLQVQTLFKKLTTQLQYSKSVAEKIEQAFVDDKQQKSKKRDLGFGLGIINLGLSIYNTYKIMDVDRKVSQMSTTMDLVSESILEQDHAITILEEKLNNLTALCTSTEMVSYYYVENMVREFNAQILTWAGGLEALLYGQLHPSLIRPETLKNGLGKLQEKAAKRGLIPLVSDLTTVFKQDISFIVKEDGMLKIFIHIPLMDREPLELFEHLEIPIKISEHLMWFVTANENNVLAIDKASSVGLQMRKLDLLYCNTKESPIGKVYFCPNTGLVKNHISETCLGALMLKTQEAEKVCQLYVSEKTEFSIQTGPRTIIAYIKDTDFLYQICDDGKRVQRKERGLATLHVQNRCTLISTDFIFKPEEDINVESDFVDSKIQMDMGGFNQLTDSENELRKALNELDEIHLTKRRNVQQLKVWISKNDLRKKEQFTNTVLIISAGSLALVSMVIIAALYYKYKQEKRMEKKSKPETIELSGRECQAQS